MPKVTQPGSRIDSRTCTLSHVFVLLKEVFNTGRAEREGGEMFQGKHEALQRAVPSPCSSQSADPLPRKRALCVCGAQGFMHAGQVRYH